MIFKIIFFVLLIIGMYTEFVVNDTTQASYYLALAAINYCIYLEDKMKKR